MARRSYPHLLLVVVAFGFGSCLLMAGPVRTQTLSKDFARLVAAYELQRVHWASWESHKESRDLIDQLATDAVPDTVSHTWTARFIAGSSGVRFLEGDSGQDKFDGVAIAELTNRGGEVWHESPDGTVRYVAPVTAKSSCIKCHVHGDTKTFEVGARLAYVSLVFSGKKRGND